MPPSPLTRRKALHLCGSALVMTLSGCASGLRGTENGQASPASSCPAGYESLTPNWIVDGPGPLSGFELRLDRDSYAPGDQFTAELRNVTDERQESGARSKYDVQFRASDGWQTIIGVPEEKAYPWPAIAARHQLGEGFTWQLTLSQEGVAGEVEPAASYRACQSFEPGDYRFVYWGITPEEEREEDVERDSALGVPFTVTD